jgi:hypothetical protein
MYTVFAASLTTSVLIHLFEVVLIWWLLIFFINLLFMTYLSGEFGGFYFFRLYFFIQEMVGFLFVFCFRNFFMFLVILFKANLGWFFSWVIFLVKLLRGYLFFIFNLFLKLLYVPLISKMTEFYSELVLIYSLILLYIYQLFIKRSKFLFFLNSCETFTNFLAGFFSSLLEVFLIFLVYFILVIQVWSEIENFLDLEKVFYFISLPLNLVFFVKVFIILLWGERRVFYLLLVVFSFMGTLGQIEFVFKRSERLIVRNSFMVFRLMVTVYLLLCWVII